MHKTKSHKTKSTKGPTGQRFYRGYTIINLGYYSPDKCVWWEAINGTGEADYHAKRLCDIIHLIDEGLADRNECESKN